MSKESAAVLLTAILGVIAILIALVVADVTNTRRFVEHGYDKAMLPGYNSPVWTLAPSHPTQTDGAGAPGRTADSGASASPADSSAAGAPGRHRRPR